MTYLGHELVRFGGRLIEASGQPNEIWQCGVRVVGVSDLQTYLDAVAPLLMQWWRLADNKNAQWAWLDYVTVATVTPTGQDPALRHTYDTPYQGPSQSIYPNFVTVSYTWETASPLAPGGRGRIYVPNAWQYVGSTLTADVAMDAAQAGVSLLDALSGGQSIEGVTPIVASKKYGTNKNIVACSVDCILDTQRRRRNQLTEYRQTASL